MVCKYQLLTITLIICLSLNLEAKIPPDYASFITKKYSDSIEINECREMESKIGQLFYINVDGNKSSYSIDPYYDQLVKRIQPGGVLPHYNTRDPDKIIKSNKVLQQQTDLPLMIGIDYQKLKADSGTVKVGLGYGPGLAGDDEIFRVLEHNTPECYKRIGLVEAAIHKALGINNPLGPTIERSKHWVGILKKEDSYKLPRLGNVVDALKGMGLETTIKHYPYTPEDYNLHKDSKDTKIPESEVDEVYMPIFKELGKRSGFLMTTHLYNSEVDPSNMATFSKKWIKKLREEIGFSGIVMTDALFMISNYSETMKKMAGDWPLEDNESEDEMTIFAAKSILAGHDMVYLESAAKQTEDIWKNLLTLSCRNGDLNKKLRDRIRESFDRIQRYKFENPTLRLNENLISNDELVVLINARNSVAKVCQEDFSDLEVIINKVRNSSTEITHNSIKCDEFDLNLESSLIERILSLKKSVGKSIPAIMIIDASLSKDLDDVNFAFNLVRSDSSILDSVLNEIKQMINSGDNDSTSKAMDSMTKLDIWGNDSSIIDEIFQSQNQILLSKYIDLMDKGSLPSLSEKGYAYGEEYLKKYLGKNKVNLDKDNRFSNEFLKLVELVFPFERLEQMTFDEIAELNFPIDFRLVLAVKKNSIITFVDAQVPELKERLIDMYMNNPYADQLRMETIFCNGFSNIIKGIQKCDGSQSVNEIYISNYAVQLLGTDLNSIPPDSRKRLKSMGSKILSENINDSEKEESQDGMTNSIDAYRRSAIEGLILSLDPNKEELDNYKRVIISKLDLSLHDPEMDSFNYAASIGNADRIAQGNRIKLSRENDLLLAQVIKKNETPKMMPWDLILFIKNNPDLFPEDRFKEHRN